MTPVPAPIIVIRKKRAHGGHHGGAWKVAYADFVTALMALFIVLWLLSSSEQVKKAVGGYFQDPTGAGKLTGTAQAGAGEGISVSKQDMDHLKEKLEQAMKELPKFEQMKNHVQMTLTHEGLRIELLETEGGMFFDSGSAQLSSTGQEIVRMLAEELSKLPNRLLIEGHTDAKPYPGDAHYTNWELSADRANAARRILEASGVPAGKIAQVRGFADQNLRTPQMPLDPANRRITVIVQHMPMPPGKGAGPP
jgi:chemotaxis protein MotB